MNNRILDIAQKAGAEQYPVEGVNTLFGDEAIEKFAELVIKETMQVVAKNIAWNGYINAAEAVIEHFRDE